MEIFSTLLKIFVDNNGTTYSNNSTTYSNNISYPLDYENELLVLESYIPVAGKDGRFVSKEISN